MYEAMHRFDRLCTMSDLEMEQTILTTLGLYLQPWSLYWDS